MYKENLSQQDSIFLSYLRGISIFVIVFGHVGGFWVFRPYSEFLHVFVPIFFFISGAFSFYSFNRSKSIWSYYKKRITGLLVPYYLLCILFIIFYSITLKKIPDFELETFLQWIQIRPSSKNSHFAIGQVWFLHTLLVIIIISPIYFLLYKRSLNTLLFIFISIVIFSGAQLFYDIGSFFIIKGNNLYKPIVHSAFFIFGMVYFSLPEKINFKKLAYIFIVFSLASIALAFLPNLNIDYAYHTYSPDLYYVCGSFTAILFFLIIKKFFISTIKINKIANAIILFFHKHTFSIFLIHSISIYLVENIFNLVHPQRVTISYGLTKLSLVLLLTCFFSIPYTRLHSFFSRKLLSII